jgi:hypothetical protein
MLKNYILPLCHYWFETINNNWKNTQISINHKTYMPCFFHWVVLSVGSLELMIHQSNKCQSVTSLATFGQMKSSPIMGVELIWILHKCIDGQMFHFFFISWKTFSELRKISPKKTIAYNMHASFFQCKILQCCQVFEFFCCKFNDFLKKGETNIFNS